MPGFRALSGSAALTMMFESGMLDADVDADSVRIGTRAHLRAYQRLRARQRLPEIGSSCAVIDRDEATEDQVHSANVLSGGLPCLATFRLMNLPRFVCSLRSWTSAPTCR